ncbi:MAG: DUF1161 domain-containing protein [Terracidiphilus sp.]
MKRLLAFAIVLCTPLCALAQAKPCEDLKAEIAKKLDAKGVTGYTLTIVDKGKEGASKVVGGCGGGTKSIVYDKAAPMPMPAAQKKPK